MKSGRAASGAWWSEKERSFSRPFRTAFHPPRLTKSLEKSGNFGTSGSMSLRAIIFLFFRWYGTIKYGDFHEKFNFLKIQDLRPLNTCQKRVEMILPNFPLDECEI